MLAKRRTNRDGPRGDTPEKVVRDVLIDSLGHRLQGGRQAMHAAWAGYFQMVPDYQIRTEAIFGRRNTVIVVGVASGSYMAPTMTAPVGTWRTPATWRALVERGRVAEWQVYADNEPIRALIRRALEKAV